MIKRNSIKIILALLVLFLTIPIDLMAGSVRVRGYFRKDGTYVQPHYRSSPDGNFYNNWSTQGNINPYTGKEGTRVTPPNFAPSLPAEPKATIPNLDSSKQLPVIQTPNIPTSNWQEEQKAKNKERATHWREKGYNFNPDYMNAYQMDAKVRDIERSRFWKDKGYSFNPDYMNSYQMDSKVRDIERAKFWKSNGHNFNPDFMNSYQMDAKVRDIERAKFWKERGYTFNPDFMNSYQMDAKARDIDRAKFWKEKGHNFNPDYMNAYQMDAEAKKRLQTNIRP